ncbi:MAG: KipI antagonist, partial [Clostridia bacterium]|nr:KipI antagonist [Clostridia bacterium]
KPIILMADHQTTGGYAKAATVISVDLSRLAQVRPGDKIRFVKTSVEQAEELAIAEKRYFENLLEM